MPSTLTYPGVYIEEIPSGVRTITGVATSITAFIGRALRGKVNDPVRIQSFADYERAFGGLWEESTMSYAVQQYFLNGGTDAVIVRVHLGGILAEITLPGGGGDLVLEAASEGAWGNELHAIVDYNTKNTNDQSLFNLTIVETEPGTDVARFTETFRNVSSDDTSPRWITNVLKEDSQLVRVKGTAPDVRPDPAAEPGLPANGAGFNGNPLDDATILGSELGKTGLYALQKTDLFNLLCIPPRDRDNDIDAGTRDAAAAYCARRRAMFIVDAPMSWQSVDDAVQELDALMTREKNAALFFPRIRLKDPLKDNRLEEFAPCGAVAGIFARTDTNRGVWKAPAGTEATLRGVRELSVKMTDGENGRLNPLGVNCLRTFPVYGHVVWGSRTLEGADALASEWKYVPVRRLALFLEESLYRGTQWVVFEPNDEPLWAQIRLNIGAFMHNLFRQGAFQGAAPKEAYFVKCDKETTTQNDINLGIVNIVVGFAPLKPAEFVIIKIQQMAGQVTA
ncbi:MAG TPA: phage tail sheath C-terminal domain-containing protein [Thermoanaerobaculia bacterium]|nr:phage tail sheath C-terminal domain-containing protein [Thermoanaerobaculia bacterium]